MTHSEESLLFEDLSEFPSILLKSKVNFVSLSSSVHFYIDDHKQMINNSIYVLNTITGSECAASLISGWMKADRKWRKSDRKWMSTAQRYALTAKKPFS